MTRRTTRAVLLVGGLWAVGAWAAADGGVSAPVAVASADGGVPVPVAVASTDGGFDPQVPESWRTSHRVGPKSAARETLLALWTAKKTGGQVGETPLTKEEAEGLLDDPRAELLYAARTVAIVAPAMVKKQRNDHLDLMKLFLAPERIKSGADFAKEHEATLAAVEKKTGVDREVIVGILMWESKLGTITGDYLAFNVFLTQAFFIDEANAVALARMDPKERKQVKAATQQARVQKIRSRALGNLAVLARQCKTRGIDPLTVKGSWAGALGFPQFMPASLRWAEDGDGDGLIDLFTMKDSIASIGRYLKEHGFARDREKAVWGYNHEAAYVQGVLAFADALKAATGRAPDAGVALDAGVKAPAARE